MISEKNMIDCLRNMVFLSRRKKSYFLKNTGVEIKNSNPRFGDPLQVQIYDRYLLFHLYLGWYFKLQCLYCSYVNGLFAYSVEIGARTERYWCPIKSAHKPRFSHWWYQDFADYGSPEQWSEKFSDEDKAFIDSWDTDKCFIK